MIVKSVEEIKKKNEKKRKKREDLFTGEAEKSSHREVTGWINNYCFWYYSSLLKYGWLKKKKILCGVKK